jgi:hypothetical protein
MVALHGRGAGTRNLIRTLGVVACLVAAAAVMPACSSGENAQEAAPSPAATVAASEATTNTEEMLLGTWNMGNYQTFTPDGTYYANTKQYFEDGSWAVAGDKVDSFETGTYTFDGATLSVTTTEPYEGYCQPDTTGQYAVTFVDADTMTLEEIDDECNGRVPAWMAGPWTRVTQLSSDG